MRIPLFGPGLNAKSSFVTAKQMTNLYAEIRPSGEKSSIVGYCTPGLELFLDFGDTPIRGGLEFEVNDVAYVVHRGTLWEINNAGVKTNRGSLSTTSGRVSMAHNGVQVMIVDGTYGYIYNTSTTVFSVITFGFTILPDSVTYLGRRFIVNTLSAGVEGRFYVSAIDNGLSWNSLDYATAESNSDPIIAVLSSNGQLMPFGDKTTEFWASSGALDFPFSQLQGTATEWGLAAKNSLAKYDNTFACLIHNRMGEVMVAKMSGYLPERISNPDIESIINSYTSVSDATAYSYMIGGHPMYVINFPTEGYTWLYDGLTKMWSKLKGFGISRHNGELSFQLLRKIIIADYSIGRLYRLSTDYLTDNGYMIERELITENIAMPDLERFSVDCVRLDIEVGVGVTTGQGSNPLVSMSVSKDNGKTWGPEIWRTIGKIGEYKTSVNWRRLGSGRNFSFKFRITDPVRVSIISACINPTD